MKKRVYSNSHEFDILNNSPENKIFWLSVCREQNRNEEFSGSLVHVREVYASLSIPKTQSLREEVNSR